MYYIDDASSFQTPKVDLPSEVFDTGGHAYFQQRSNNLGILPRLIYYICTTINFAFIDEK